MLEIIAYYLGGGGVYIVYIAYMSYIQSTLVNSTMHNSILSLIST